MTFKTSRIDSANALVSGAISITKIEEKIQKVVQKIAKSIKIDGFRKGKVPAQVIKSRYKEQVQQDAEKEAIQDLLDSALKELDIATEKLIGNPVIAKFDRKNDKIELEIKLSIMPTFSIESIQQYVPEVKLKPISQAQIEERLLEIAESRAPLNEITQERGLEKGDTANIDFEGFINGKPFDGGKGKNTNLVIGSNQFIPGFEEALIGMKKGERRGIDVRFPKDYQAAHLADKSAKFDVLLHKILQKDKIEIDDAFAKSIIGADSTLQSLKDMIQEQLLNEQKNELYNKELKEQLVEAILEHITFDLPDSIVEQEMDILFRNALAKLSPKELEAIKNNQQDANKKRESHRDEARRSVQLTFITDTLAKSYNITIQDNEVFQTIYYEAMMSGRDPRAELEYYQKSNLLPAIKMTMIEDRVLHYLLDEKFNKAKDVTSKPSSPNTTKKADKTKETKSKETNE